MLKRLVILATSLLTIGLNAETIGNVEFQFPPSLYEWKLFVDQNFYSDFFFGNYFDDDEDDDEEEVDGTTLKLFTHREGDALELFVAIQIKNDDDDDEEEDEEPDTILVVQEEIDECVNQLFPNHRFQILSLTDSGNDGILEWELHDGSVDLMHGYHRYIKTEDSVTILGYFTTAARTDCNRILWTDVLNYAQ